MHRKYCELNELIQMMNDRERTNERDETIDAFVTNTYHRREKFGYFGLELCTEIAYLCTEIYIGIHDISSLGQ